MSNNQSKKNSHQLINKLNINDIILSVWESSIRRGKVIFDVKTISIDELALLGKLEEANRLIESDVKSCNSLDGGNSRKTSDAASSSASGCNDDNDDDKSSKDETPTDGEVDVWKKWGHIVADWDNYWKKHKDVIKELVKQGIPHHFRYITTINNFFLKQSLYYLF